MFERKTSTHMNIFAIVGVGFLSDVLKTKKSSIPHFEIRMLFCEHKKMTKSFSLGGFSLIKSHPFISSFASSSSL
jgi:hypothetical protein